MFVDVPAVYDTVSGTARNTLVLNSAVSIVLPLLGLHLHFLLLSESSQTSTSSLSVRPSSSYPFLRYHLLPHPHPYPRSRAQRHTTPSAPPCASESCSSPP
jgi:hypothetical protein